jgi:hypothetical protein
MTMNAPVAPQNIGANRPPLVTAEQLAKDYGYVEEAVSGFEKQLADTPLVIEDDEDLAIITALVPKLRGGIKRVDDLRDQNKRPHLDANDVIQKFFKAFETRIEAVKTTLEKRGKSYMDKKAAAETARLEAEAAAARAAQAEHEKAAVTAAQSGDTEAMKAASTAAREAETRAETASVAATAKPADLVRTTTASGNTASLKQNWVGTVVNFSTIDVVKLRPYFGPADIEKALRAFVKAGGRECSGAEIKQETSPDFR